MEYTSRSSGPGLAMLALRPLTAGVGWSWLDAMELHVAKLAAVAGRVSQVRPICGR